MSQSPVSIQGFRRSRRIAGLPIVTYEETYDSSELSDAEPWESESESDAEEKKIDLATTICLKITQYFGFLLVSAAVVRALFA